MGMLDWIICAFLVGPKTNQRINRRLDGQRHIPPKSWTATPDLVHSPPQLQDNTLHPILDPFALTPCDCTHT